MSEYDPYNEFSGEQPPIPIPPVEEGWEKMALQLNSALPATSLQRFVAKVWKFICIDVSIVAIVFTNVIYTNSNKTSQESKKTKAAQYIVANDSSSRQPDSIQQEQVSPQDFYWQPENDNKNKTATGKLDDDTSPDISKAKKNGTLKDDNQKRSITLNKQQGQKQSAAENENNDHIAESKKQVEIPAGLSEDRKQGANSISPAEKTGFNPHPKSVSHTKAPFKKTAQTPAEKLTMTTELHPDIINKSGELTDIGHDDSKEVGIRLRNEWPDIHALTKELRIPCGLSKPPPGVPGNIINRTQSTARERSWQFQLQLPYLLPFSNTNGYLDGQAGDQQLYRLFLPALRVANMTSMAGWSLDINPWSFQLYPDSPFYRKSSGLANQQTKEIWSLRQTYGISVTGLYHRRITGNWWAAAGGTLYFARKASVLKTKVDTLGNQASQVIASDSGMIFQHVKQLQGNIVAETYIDIARFQGGIRMNIPALVMAKDSVGKTIKPPNLTVEVLLRFKLNSLFTKKPHR